MSVGQKATPRAGYWAVLSARVRRDRSLRANAKLLYAEIAALLGPEGYCWATNAFFADTLGITARAVRGLLVELEEHGYIFSQVVRDEATNEVVQRRIYTRETLPVIEDDPSGKDFHDPSGKSFQDPSGKNFPLDQDNNIPDIPPKAPQGGRRSRRREPKKTAEWKPELWERFWRLYPRGENKQGAIRAWDNLKPDDETIRAMSQTLKRQMASPEWQAGIGVPYASTWLNQRRWEDEEKAPPGGSGGWEEDPEVY